MTDAETKEKIYTDIISDMEEIAKLKEQLRLQQLNVLLKRIKDIEVMIESMKKVQ